MRRSFPALPGLLGLALALLLGASRSAPAAPTSVPPRGSPERIVSMNPSLTEILVALGAGDRIVGVDEYSARIEPTVATLPRVGGLFHPSLEAVVALRPDLVVLVPSFEQRAFRERLAQLDLSVLSLDPVGYDDVLRSIEVLGARVGALRAARARVAEIRATRSQVETVVRGRPSPRTVVVLQRDPLFVVGRGSFVDDLLGAAGATNLGATLDAPYPRVSVEWLLGAAPDVILDSAPDPEAARAFWRRWPSVPAVANGRIHAIPAEIVTLPGPALDRALLELVRRLHGPELLGHLGTAR